MQRIRVKYCTKNKQLEFVCIEQCQIGFMLRNTQVLKFVVQAKTKLRTVFFQVMWFV